MIFYQPDLMEVGSGALQGGAKYDWPIPFQDLSSNRVPFADLSRAFRAFQRALPLKTSVKFGSTFVVNRGIFLSNTCHQPSQACVFSLDRNQYVFLKSSKMHFAPDPLPSCNHHRPPLQKKQSECFQASGIKSPKPHMGAFRHGPETHSSGNKTKYV